MSSGRTRAGADRARNDWGQPDRWAGRGWNWLAILALGILAFGVGDLLIHQKAELDILRRLPEQSGQLARETTPGPPARR